MTVWPFALADREVERDVEVPAADADALEILRRGQADEQPFRFASSALDNRDFGVKRLIELGFHVDRAEAQRHRVRSAQRERDRKR